MNEFVSIEVLGTIAGCSMIVTLLTQVFKRYLPNTIDTKWLALLFSVIVGGLRMVYIHQYDFDGIVSGVFNIFVLLSIAIGLYEIGEPTAKKFISLFDKNEQEVKDDDEERN